MARYFSASIYKSLLDLSQGRRPLGVVKPEVFDNAAFDSKWDRSKS